mgnify:FL=1
MNKAIFSLLIAGFLSACSPQPASQEKTLYVSILPIRSLVKEVVGEEFRIEVLVPPGASPETFEPTPRQFIGLNEAQLVFNVGLLEFETALLDKIEDRTKIVDLSRGIVRIEGSCAHAGRNGSDHAHGVDPHVWTSPRALQRMAKNAYEAIHARWPDSAKYTANHARLQEELRQLDLRTAEKIARSGIRYFIIYHPALTYYARDYGLRQEAVEADGKEPSAKRLTALIRQARKDGIGRILYQNQFPVSVVETIARDIGAECTEIDPLREDAIANIDSITDLIVRPQ